MKMIQLNYCKAHWDKDWQQLMVDKKDQSTLINLDLIATVSPEAVQGRAVDKSGTAIINLHYVRTTVPYSCGINGTDYYSYYVTEGTYKKICLETLS